MWSRKEILKRDKLDFNNMSILLDIFDSDDDDFLMWAFASISMGTMFESEEISEKQCGSVDDHKNQEAQSVVQDSQVDLQEGCKEEQSVEDQWDEPHEIDCKDMAEEDKAGENLNCDDLINISVCAEVTSVNDEDIIADFQMVDTRNSERENSPIQPVIILRRARIRIQAFHHWGRNDVKIHHYLMARKEKMKPRLKMNKYGLCCKKTKMKTSVTKLFYVLIVSLAETETSKCMLLFSILSPLSGSVGINGES